MNNDLKLNLDPILQWPFIENFQSAPLNRPFIENKYDDFILKEENND